MHNLKRDLSHLDMEPPFRYQFHETMETVEHQPFPLFVLHDVEGVGSVTGGDLIAVSRKIIGVLNDLSWHDCDVAFFIFPKWNIEDP